eukprot:TRINITY_DN48898_c0_g1_i1.p1 TRINITY_DN48898_c0_g1~~TRINITY_DN48898_c0_g1_i1.p1  ORF type:complete len:804 (+),score=152.82 TRINITY_DN48898_c0_g1_i1:74-2485(+)
MDPRAKIEDVFRCRSSHADGNLSRADYGKLLQRAGLARSEATALLDALDPDKRDFLSIDSFLNFIYDSKEEHTKPAVGLPLSQKAQKAVVEGIGCLGGTATTMAPSTPGGAVPGCHSGQGSGTSNSDVAGELMIDLAEVVDIDAVEADAADIAAGVARVADIVAGAAAAAEHEAEGVGDAFGAGGISARSVPSQTPGCSTSDAMKASGGGDGAAGLAGGDTGCGGDVEAGGGNNVVEDVGQGGAGTNAAGVDAASSAYDNAAEASRDVSVAPPPTDPATTAPSDGGGTESVAAEPSVGADVSAGCSRVDGGEDSVAETTVLEAAAAEKPRPRHCSQCFERGEVFQDPSDAKMYCERCWISYYGIPPVRDAAGNGLPAKLVTVVQGDIWSENRLRDRWKVTVVPGWPPPVAPTVGVPAAAAPPGSPLSKDLWCNVRIRVVADLVGPHAREASRQERPWVGEVLSGRYRIESVVGAGHFTRALLAVDVTTNQRVCVKRHNGLTVETLTDLCAIGYRLEAVDPHSEHFPRFLDAFFDMSGYSVEAIVEGRDCLKISRSDPHHFAKLSNLRYVAVGVLRALVKLAAASVVHCDLKSDNIMWVDVPGGPPIIRVVDFGCARLDSRTESGRNWALVEGGAGHLGKWAPEMVLRLPITDRADIWGLAVSLLEMNCGRAMWACESDTVEIVLAQALGLANARRGMPLSLLRRSPLDITRLYSAGMNHFPIRRINGEHEAPYEELRPATWGLECVLGRESTWDKVRRDFASYVMTSLSMDHEERPSAAEMLGHPFVSEQPVAGTSASAQSES